MTDRPSSSAAAPAPGNATIAIVALAAVGFASQAMVRSTDSLLPQIAHDIGATVGATSMIVTLYLMAHGTAQLVAGPAGDRFGKYRFVTICASLATLAVIACGFANGLPALVVARLATGLASGAMIPLSMAFIGDVTPMARRQQVLGSFLSGQILGQMFGQAASGVIGDYLGWRNVFFVLGGMLAIAAAGLIVQLATNPVTRAQTGAGNSGPGFVEGYRIVLSSRWSLTLIFASFVESAAMFGALTYIGAHLHSRFDLSFTLVGLFVGAFAAGGLTYTFSVGFMVRWLGQVGLTRFGGLIMGVSLLLLALTPVYWLAPIATAGCGLGFYMLHNTLQVHATQMAPGARGTAVALFSSALYMGQMAGVAVFALIYDRYTASPVFIISAVSVIGLGLWISRLIRQRIEQGIA